VPTLCKRNYVTRRSTLTRSHVPRYSRVARRRRLCVVAVRPPVLWGDVPARSRSRRVRMHATSQSLYGIFLGSPHPSQLRVRGSPAPHGVYYPLPFRVSVPLVPTTVVSIRQRALLPHEGCARSYMMPPSQRPSAPPTAQYFSYGGREVCGMLRMANNNLTTHCTSSFGMRQGRGCGFRL